MNIKQVTISNNPFQPKFEVVGNLIVKLHVPYSERDVNIMINPNISEYIEKKNEVDVKIHHFSITINNERSSILYFNLDGNNENKHTFVNDDRSIWEQYNFKLLDIRKKRIQGQDFPIFIFQIEWDNIDNE
ncbi:MAG: hypothetical protein NT007_08005 [Candidatus Kapabacteria bacterium]|nr:hypothetical protein [Candidatus Kapabacteria bacterium]